LFQSPKIPCDQFRDEVFVKVRHGFRNPMVAFATA